MELKRIGMDTSKSVFTPHGGDAALGELPPLAEGALALLAAWRGPTPATA